MADLALGVAKSLVEATLAKAQSARETEVKLRQSAESDLAFITAEFQEMQSFLDVLDEESAKNEVVKTWVKIVRGLAYDYEDRMEFMDQYVDNKRDWWFRLPLPCISMTLPLDEAAAELKQLRGRVEDASNWNRRGKLINELGFTEAAAIAKMQEDLGRCLTQFITKESSDDLRVISVWGTAGGDLDLGFILAVRKAYLAPDTCQLFPACRGWLKLTDPLNPHEVLRSLMTQFYTNSCLQIEASVDVDELVRMEETTTTQIGLIKEFMKQVNEKRYLVILENVSNMGQWDAIRTYLPDRKNGSLIIVCTQPREIASMCVGDSHQVLELNKYYTNKQSLCVFFKEGSQEKEADGMMEDEVSYSSDLSPDRVLTNKKDRARSWMNNSKRLFTLRELQFNKKLRYCVDDALLKGLNIVMSVCGIPGIGKSDLVRNFYYDGMLERPHTFRQYAWVNVSHPFNIRDFCRSLLSDLHLATGVKNHILMCRRLLKENRCLVVIDKLQSNEEWDSIKHALKPEGSTSVIIVITDQATVGKHCTDNDDEFIINVSCLGREDAIHLFNEVCRWREPEASAPLLRGLISNCGGIPKVIVAIANFLATSTSQYMDRIRTLNFRFLSELESNAELFGSVEGIFSWLNSYIHACPDFLKRSILYLSIFPQYLIIRRRRLVMRWIAEGYCKDTGNSSEEGSGEFYFSRLLSTNIVQQYPHLVTDVLGSRRMVFCQVNNLLNGYIISQAMEENLVLQLKGICSQTAQRTGRHLVIDSSWDRDRIVFESIDFSRLRSLTVFGQWRSFFISASMNVLRVLDLEDAIGVKDKDIDRLVKLLPRLRFLSLRGCREISHLPSSLGDLRQLETLDVRYTSIITLPSFITKLKKLQYIRAGTSILTEEQPTVCSSSWLSGFCRRQQLDGSTRVAPDGVKVTPAIGKLTALHTLGVVNVSDAGGKDILKELKNLIQLRKLGVSRVNKKNIKEFCSAISYATNLESLSVKLSKGNQESLDDINFPPENLQSLKLFGFVRGLPAWIGRLHNLTKLDLEITLSAEVDIIRVLRDTRKLCILRLRARWLQPGAGKLDFRVFTNGIEESCFQKLKILYLACISSEVHVSFGSQSMRNLELLTVRCCSGSTLKFSDLNHLPRLNEVWLAGSHEDELKVGIETQLREHPNQPSLKQVE